MTALECAFALLKCSPIGNPENSSEYGRAAYILSEHCQGKEDVSEAAMRIFAERIAELERERSEALELLASEKITRNHIIKRSVEVEKERDEAQAERDILRSNKMSDPLLQTTFKHLICERDEARAIAYDLATIASHCLGWHDHETGDAAERIASVLRRWKDAK